MKSTILLCALLLAGCGGGDSSTPAEPAAASVARWTEQASIPGACCYYSSLVVTGGGYRIYTNTAPDGAAGDLHLYEGGVSHKVLHIDAPADAFIRTSAVIEAGGKWVALLETGDAYPGTNGYSPSWATSPDGIAWAWHGPVSPYPRALSSGAALTVDEQGHFRAWLDIGNVLHEMRSDDGLKWADAGTVPAPGVTFATAARTPAGTMLAVADTWPSTSIATLWQCHGKEWTVLEERSAIHHGDKGAALTYAGGLIHAYSMGRHWTSAPPTCV